MERLRVVRGALAALFLVQTAAAVDVPTWQPDDWWDVERTFALAFNTTEPLDLAVSLATVEEFRLTVVDVGERTTTRTGTVTVYERRRSGGELSGQGTVTIGGIPMNLRWAQGGTSTGDDWIAVGDLGRVYEHFALSGALEAQLLFFWQDIATITIDVSFALDPTQETADFPIETEGEQWETTVTQHVYGRIQVAWNSDFPLWPDGTPPDNLDQVFDNDATRSLLYRFVRREARGNLQETYLIEQSPAGSLWYAPAIKEFVEIALDNLDLGGGNRLDDFVTRIVDWGLAADPDIDVFDFIPSRPRPGDWVLLRGLTDPHTTVTATILGEGLSAQTISRISGEFELWLQCPDHDDFSPSTDDLGSFGVEVVAAGVGRKLATVQLGLAATSARSSWALYR